MGLPLNDSNYFDKPLNHSQFITTIKNPDYENGTNNNNDDIVRL